MNWKRKNIELTTNAKVGEVLDLNSRKILVCFGVKCAKCYFNNCCKNSGIKCTSEERSDGIGVHYEKI